jgi:hypothetical protein
MSCKTCQGSTIEATDDELKYNQESWKIHLPLPLLPSPGLQQKKRVTGLNKLTKGFREGAYTNMRKS